MSEPRVQILLVEDNPGDARLIRALLDEAGPGRFGLVHEASLAGALRKLSERAPDAVLLDLNLPDEQGVETVARINAAAPRVPIVVLTGTTDEEIAARAMAHGAQEYLVKGRVDGAGLVRALRHALVRKRATEGARLLAAEQQARTHAEQRAVHFAAVAQIARALVEAADVRQGCAAAAEKVSATVGGACAISAMDASGGAIRLAQSGADEALAATGAVAAPPHALLVEDAAGSHPEIAAAGAVSFAIVPLSARGRIFGRLAVTSPARRLNRADLQFLQAAAHVLALAIAAAP